MASDIGWRFTDCRTGWCYSIKTLRICMYLIIRCWRLGYEVALDGVLIQVYAVDFNLILVTRHVSKQSMYTYNLITCSLTQAIADLNLPLRRTINLKMTMPIVGWSTHCAGCCPK